MVLKYLITWAYGIASDLVFHIVDGDRLCEPDDGSLGSHIGTPKGRPLDAGSHRGHVDDVAGNTLLFPLQEG